MIFRKERTFWMKRKTLIALVLLACMLLTACGSTGGSTDSSSDTVVESSTPEPVEAKADAKDGEDFRNNLAAGLNARLALVDSDMLSNADKSVDKNTSYVNAELDALGKYEDYVDHPENYTQEEAEKYTADTMPENLSWFLSFGTYCRGIGLDPDCAADILTNPEDYYDSLSIFFPAANFTVEVYSSSGELVAEKPVFYENYAVGEKLRGTDTEQIHLYLSLIHI